MRTYKGQDDELAEVLVGCGCVGIILTVFLLGCGLIGSIIYYLVTH